MFDGKFIATLFALSIAVLAICNYKTNNKITSREDFLGTLPSVKARVARGIVGKNGDLVGDPNQYTNMMNQARQSINQTNKLETEFYTVPGTYQSMLSPRFSNTQYGASINYNTPTRENMAVPVEPLDFGLMTNESYQENYGCNNCNSTGCRKGGASALSYNAPPLMAADFSSGNYKELSDNAKSELYQETTDMIPVQDMTTLNTDGETVQPIVYDRLIYANRNSRIRSQGDMIRGDLPIVPCNTGWFQVSAHPVLDLQEGAMNVMGGVNNTTATELATLIATTTAGTDTTIGGVDLTQQPQSVTMATLRQIGQSAALSDVNVTAFP